MPPNIGPDIVFRATISDQTAKGAASAKSTIDKLSKESQRLIRATGGGGEGGDWSRVLRDKSTSGLDPLSRAFNSKIGQAGLAVGGVAVAAVSLDTLTTKGMEMLKVWETGKEDAASMTEKIADQIPILRNIFHIGENIHEFLTEEKAGLEREKELTDEIVDAQDRRFASSLRNKEVLLDQAAALRALQRETALVGVRGTPGETGAIQARTSGAADQLAAQAQKIKDQALQDPDRKAAEKAINDWNEKHGERLAQLLPMNLTQEHFGSRPSATLKKERDDLLAQSDQLHNALRAKSNQTNARRDADIAAANDSAAAEAKKGNAQIAEIQLRHQQDMGQKGKEQSSADQQMADQSKARALETAGAVGDAKRLEIEASSDAAKRQAQLEADALKNATSDADEQAVIQGRADAKIFQIEKDKQSRLAEANKQIGLDRRRATFAAGQAEADATAEATAARLRETGQGYEAEKVLRARALEEQKAQLDEQATEQIALNKDNAAQILAKTEGEKKKLDAQAKERERQAGESERSGQFGIARDIIAGRVDALQLEARSGNILAATESKRLQIAEEFVEKREKLNRLIRDPNVNAAEKGLAQSQLSGLDAQEARAKQLAYFTGGTQVPGAVISARGSGAASRAREEASSSVQLSRLMKEGNTDARATRLATQQMADALKKNPILAPLLVGVN